MQEIIHLDQALFLKLHLAGSEPWDTLMYYATKSWVWLPLFSFWLYLLWKAQPRRFWQWVVLAIFAVAATDMLCGQVLKPLFGRVRPSHEPSLRSHLHLVRGYAGGLYSFPSNHAANSLALTLIIGQALRQRLFWLTGLSWVLFHSYTRLYLGVHYPLDLIGGWLLGALVSFSFLQLAKYKRLI